jgi:hypothetical protein
MSLKTSGGGPKKTNKFQFMAGSPLPSFDRDLRHPEDKKILTATVNTPRTQAYHPTVGIRIRF